MNFHIADSFTSALSRLTGQEQKQAKTAAFDLQLNPAQPGLQMHRLTNSRDPNFWSVRVNQDMLDASPTSGIITTQPSR